MIVDIARLPENGDVFTGKEAPSILELADEEMARVEQPIHYSLSAVLVSGELIIKGRLSVEVLFRCSRCSVFFPVKVEETQFVRVIEVGLETQSVDLTEDIREAILLLFPAYPVCSEGCRGLCPQCGADLNKTDCDCVKPTNTRWSELDNLKLD